MVMHAVPVKSLESKYENVHLILDDEVLTLYASDGELSITAKSKVSTSDKGTVTLKARTLQEYLRSMYETELKFEIERQTMSNQGIVHIATDKGRYKILCIFDGKYYERENTYDVVIGFKSGELQDMIQKTLFACSVDGMRPAMMGVLFEFEGGGVTAVSTDGHRLVRNKKTTTIDTGEKKKIVVPSRVLSIVQKLPQDTEVTMSVDADRRYVRFIAENVTIESALIVEPYPNYEAVIPVENEKRMHIDRLQIYDSVKRVGRFVRAGEGEKISDIKIVLNDQKIIIIGENQFGESAYEEVESTYSGADMTIGFNSSLVETALAHLETEQVAIEFTKPTTAVIFKPEPAIQTEEYIILVMPVRINN